MRPDALPRLNKRRADGSPQSQPLPPDTEALIRQYYRHEMDLYDYALAVHRAQVDLVEGLATGR
jgi:hypothetical protein